MRKIEQKKKNNKKKSVTLFVELRFFLLLLFFQLDKNLKNTKKVYGVMIDTKIYVSLLSERFTMTDSAMFHVIQCKESLLQ